MLCYINHLCYNPAAAWHTNKPSIYGGLSRNYGDTVKSDNVNKSHGKYKAQRAEM